VAKAAGLKARLDFDASKPDGVARKLVDVSKLSDLGWRASIGLEEGLASTYRWFLDHHAEARGVHA
jgi:GDP-L-fucose synthase